MRKGSVAAGSGADSTAAWELLGEVAAKDPRMMEVSPAWLSREAQKVGSGQWRRAVVVMPADVNAWRLLVWAG